MKRIAGVYTAVSGVWYTRRVTNADTNMQSHYRVIVFLIRKGSQHNYLSSPLHTVHTHINHILKHVQTNPKLATAICTKKQVPKISGHSLLTYSLIPCWVYNQDSKYHKSHWVTQGTACTIINYTHTICCQLRRKAFHSDKGIRENLLN